MELVAAPPQLSLEFPYSAISNLIKFDCSSASINVIEPFGIDIFSNLETKSSSMLN